MVKKSSSPSQRRTPAQPSPHRTWARVGHVFLLVLFLAGCNEGQPALTPAPATVTAVPPTATATNTPTSTHTATPSATFTATFTPTPTATPTATAVPLVVSGNPRPAQLSNPVPQANAPCGLVDTLDFPIDPPDAATVSRGGIDFGVFRQRYDKYHAGEDWGGPAGQPNLGTPVYSVGHGLVTYAHPLGWNRDKGVLIVQHTFADGRILYSFYGHLDPPSVVLTAGACVRRGALVGEIGQPRSSPHLHFEIRTHLPYTPGPGYWPEDPTTAGWLPPSATIWQARLAAAPGVQWVRPSAAQGVGQVDAETVAVLEEGQLVGLNVHNGRVRWRYASPDEETISNALPEPAQAIIYVAGQFGRLIALRPPQPDAALTFTTLWQLDLEVIRAPALLPLPGGGVVLLGRQQMAAVSAAGELLWQYEFPARPFAWDASADLLAVTVSGDSGGVWTIDRNGPVGWIGPTGRPVVAGAQVWIYAADGIYRLNRDTLFTDLVLPLPEALRASGDAIALPDGGLLLAHSDRHGRRLIAVNGDGSVRWDRSFTGLVLGEVRLVAGDGRVYLIADRLQNGAAELTVFAVNPDTAELTRLLIGGSRTARPMQTWALAAAQELLLVNVGGGHLVAIKPVD